MVKEAVLIQEQASLNSKSEFRGYKVARLTVEKQDWQIRKDQEIEAKAARDLDKELSDHKLNVERFAKAQPSDSLNVSNFQFSCRKRKGSPEMDPKTPTNFVTVRGVKWGGPRRKAARVSEPGTPEQSAH